MSCVSIRLADAWPFQPHASAASSQRSFLVSIRLADAWPFQPTAYTTLSDHRLRVSIRLADAWPFQPAYYWGGNGYTGGVSIRLADAWPFQPGVGARGLGCGVLFQSALRMRGLFNRVPVHRFPEFRRNVSIRLADAWPFQHVMRRRVGGQLLGFNPPCGCVAFSTARARACFPGFCVSIRLADAWPFQRFLLCRPALMHERFNPPCGCVAFSTCAADHFHKVQPVVSIRLADAWPFQQWSNKHAWGEQDVSIRLADAWPFQHGPAVGVDQGKEKFQSALRMRGLFNVWNSSTNQALMGFQSALRMRGLFNFMSITVAIVTVDVSIRLADAWPFQPARGYAHRAHARAFQSALRMRGLFNALHMLGRCPCGDGFNPPCGCVAFSTLAYPHY